MKTRCRTTLARALAATALVSGGLSLTLCGIPSALAKSADNSAPATEQAPHQWRYYPNPPEAPRGAPNVLLIMTDDVGFSASTAYGGAIPTPTFDALAKEGIKYNAFYTTAMCSPTRAALLTGRNHHAVASGAISNLATDQKGYTSVMPASAATIGRVMQMNGYATAFIGKNHNTPVWETGPTGPFNHWPNAMGFDYFYGFNSAMSDQFNPQLVENRNPIEAPENDPAYNLDRDFSDHLLHWLQVQHTVRPNKPFFAYWAPGTVHSPHQAPADWIARFKGKFDMGWDKLREQTFERQKKLGIIPANAVLTARPKGLPAWDSLTPEEQHVAARMMEVAAAQLAQCDYQIGRVVDWLKKSGQFDNTLIIFIQGDNGASDESLNGANDEMASLLGIEPTQAELAKTLDIHGGPLGFGNYPAAWGWATNTPFQWGKEIASHLGGLRDGMVISWPDRIKQHDGLRTQFSHIIDIAPTIYEAAGITPPAKVDGVVQQPIDGTSLVYSFNAPNAPERHRQQYFEMLGNRGYYKDGWFANTIPEIAPWDRKHPPVDPYKFKWQLFNLRDDYSQSHDLAAQDPKKLAELKKDFDAAATKFHVYPLGANLMTRFAPSNRPSLLAGRTHFTYYPGDTRYPENSFPSISRGWTLTAHLVVGSDEARGPIAIGGNHSSGFGFSLENGFPRFFYNPTGRDKERVILGSDRPLDTGKHTVSVHFQPDDAAGARASVLKMEIDGQPVASASVPVTYRVFGYTYVGRDGLGLLFAGQQRGPLSGATLTSLDVDTE
ncbi:arylsulfatase [Novosphingobium sp. ZN18A2]|uniref:arylsulfatase n=1 Tax=Novosphingobium sp. ZN18A2 TaxID=3079861 RepID=UPI0030CC64ED